MTGGGDRNQRELVETVDLCDATGRLNPQAWGWSRTPLHRDNLRGAFWRKKRWHYWCVMDHRFAFSSTVAHIDYAALGGVYVLDFASGAFHETGAVRPFPRRFPMPETPTGTLRFEKRGFSLELHDTGDTAHLRFEGRLGGKPLRADIAVDRPRGHESLNVVVPWSDRRFQFTSKQAALPATGTLDWGGIRHTFGDGAWAVLDYGRGVWPYRSAWNWAAASGRGGGHVVGLNLGAGWTDGTGANENGLLLDGRLHKLHEDVTFEHDSADLMRPWRLRTANSPAVDLTFTPAHERRFRANLGLLAAHGSQCFGRFDGTVTVEGETHAIDHLRGWAEECRWRW